MGEFSKEMSRRGVPVSAIVLRLGFDPSTSFPKLTFAAVRYLTEQEVARVLKEQGSDAVKQATGEDDVPATVGAPIQVPTPVAAAALNQVNAQVPAAAEVPKRGRGRPAKAAEAPAVTPAAPPSPPAAPAMQYDDAIKVETGGGGLSSKTLDGLLDGLLS
jgi:hypothetical protein